MSVHTELVPARQLAVGDVLLPTDGGAVPDSFTYGRVATFTRWPGRVALTVETLDPQPPGARVLPMHALPFSLPADAAVMVARAFG